MDGLHLPHTHNDYTIGWVCALPNEQSAAIFMLDERHEDLPNPPGDQNTYILGSIGKHNVVIAGLPLGRVGNNTAATVATRMVSTFPNIRVGLMVGIGGGIPQKTRLGDVVISCPRDTEPGVIQWDMGKREAGKFIRTGSLAPPPTALLTALTRFKADQIRTRTNMLNYLKNLESIPNIPKSFLKSDSLQDVLYDSSYSHIDADDFRHGHTDEDDCHLCDKSKVIRISQRESGMIHCGLIASGNQVIKDAILRDKLYEKFNNNILCIEMEAAGLMNDFPCVVIRGISDYSDSHKGKKWQDYAAATAAACAKALLMVVATSEVDQLQRVQLTISPGIIQGAIKLWPFWRNDKKDALHPQVTIPEETNLKTAPQLLHSSQLETAGPGDMSPDTKSREIPPDEKPRETIPTEASKQINPDNTSLTQQMLEVWLRAAPPPIVMMLQQGDIEAVVRSICMALSQLSALQESLPRGYAIGENNKCGGNYCDLEATNGSYAEMLPPGRNNSVSSQAPIPFPEEYKGHTSEKNHNYDNERRHSNSVPHSVPALSPFQPESRGHDREQSPTKSHNGNASPRPQTPSTSTEYPPQALSPFQNGHGNLVSEQNHGKISTRPALPSLQISTKYPSNGYGAVDNGARYNQYPWSPPESPASLPNTSQSGSLRRIGESPKKGGRNSLAHDSGTENNRFFEAKGENHQYYAEPDLINPNEGQHNATPNHNRQSSLMVENASVHGPGAGNNEIYSGYGRYRYPERSVINSSKGQRSTTPVQGQRPSLMARNKSILGPAIGNSDHGLGYKRPYIQGQTRSTLVRDNAARLPIKADSRISNNYEEKSRQSVGTEASQPHSQSTPPNLIRKVQP